MLSFDKLSELKVALAAHLQRDTDEETKEAKDAFRELAPALQLEVLATCSPKTDPQVLKAFLVAFRASSGSVELGSMAHQKLFLEMMGSEVPNGWHKESPPKTPFEMMNPHRNPSWTDELKACSEIAYKTSHAVLINEDFMGMEIKNHFQIGGFEDIGLARGVQPQDDTMQVIIEAVRQNLAALRPDWFGEDSVTPLATLPAGVSASSLNAIQEAQEAELAAKRAEERRQAQQQRQEQALVKMNAGLTGLGTELQGSLTWGPVIDATIGAGFEEAQKTLKGEGFLSDELYAHAIEAHSAVQYAIEAGAVPLPVEPTEAGDLPSEEELIGLVITDEALSAKLQRFIELAFLVQLSVHEPTWFSPRSGGGVKFRRGLGSDRPRGPSRSVKVVLRHLEADVVKYGRADVVAAIAAFLEDATPDVGDDVGDDQTPEEED